MKWLLFSVKRYATPLLSALLVAGVIGIWWHGYTMGKERQRLVMLDAVDQARIAQERLADELEQAKADRRIVYRDRIRYVDRVIDDCADVPVPDGVFSALGGSDG
jgi:hypothetical protein